MKARLCILTLVVSLFCGVRGMAEPAATPSFDHSPTRVLFMIETKGGFASTLQELTALPDFVLYGDGTAVYTHYDKVKDLRILMAVRLPANVVAQEIAFIQAQGWNDWYDRYENTALPNLPTTTMQLNLTGSATHRSVYGLAFAMEQHNAPAGLGEIFKHFQNYHAKGEYEYPIDRVRLFARRLSRMDAKRGYKTLGWGIKGIPLTDIAHDSEDFGEKEFTGADADRIVNRLREWTLYSTDLSVIFFKDKKETYQVGYRPVLPHE